MVDSYYHVPGTAPKDALGRMRDDLERAYRSDPRYAYRELMDTLDDIASSIIELEEGDEMIPTEYKEELEEGARDYQEVIDDIPSRLAPLHSFVAAMVKLRAEVDDFDELDNNETIKAAKEHRLIYVGLRDLAADLGIYDETPSLPLLRRGLAELADHPLWIDALKRNDAGDFLAQVITAGLKEL